MQSLNNGISNVNSKVDSEIRKAIVSSLQEVLTEYGYGRQYATILSEALVGSSLDFYSTGNFLRTQKLTLILSLEMLFPIRIMSNYMGMQ